MLLDWFTIGAQALNFLILVWLMKHFLYKPILNAIDAREKLVAKELADAEAKKSEAQKERDEYQKKNEAFDQQRAALLTKATDEAKTERLRLLEAARQAADALSAKRQASLISDAQSLHEAISRLTQREVFAITRKALTDLATVSLEERMGEVFTRRLRELDDKAKALLGEALKKNSEPALVRSSFDLPAVQRAAIQNALNETFSAEIHIRFETAPDLVSGIELTTNGQKVGWSIADYLATLEKGVGDLLKEKDQPEPKPELKTEVKAEPKLEAPKREDKPTPGAEAAAEPKPVPAIAPQSKTEAKPESKPNAEAGAKPEMIVKPETEAVAKPESKIGPQSVAKPKAPSALTPQTFKRVHELYEELGRADVQAVQAWEKAERDNGEGEVSTKIETKPTVGAAPKPEFMHEPEPNGKVESQPTIKTS